MGLWSAECSSAIGVNLRNLHSSYDDDEDDEDYIGTTRGEYQCHKQLAQAVWHTSDNDGICGGNDSDYVEGTRGD